MLHCILNFITLIYMTSKYFPQDSLQTMYQTTHLNIRLPAIFDSSLLTCSPFFASKLRISSLDDRALTCSNKNGKEKCTEYSKNIYPPFMDPKIE